MTGIEARNAQFNGGPGQRLTISTSFSTTSSTTSSTETSTTQPLAATTTSSGSSLIGSTTSKTLATQTSSQITSVSSSAIQQGLSSSTSAQPEPSQAAVSSSQSAANSAIPLGQTYDRGSGNGISSGAIAAAVIVPILIFAFLFGLFFVLRRRRQSGAISPATRERNMADNANGTAIPFVTALMTGHTNNAYYTGLDDGSEREHSGEFYAAGHSDSSSFGEPPPPYKVKTHDPSGGPIQASAIGAVPLVRLPSGMPTSPPSPDSWATAPHDAAFLDTGSAFTRSTSRAGTEASINSDSYSDGASVHSAHAARMSVGGANMIRQANASQTDFNPFNDPQSPVSSINGDESRSLRSNAPSRGISPASFR